MLDLRRDGDDASRDCWDFDVVGQLDPAPRLFFVFVFADQDAFAERLSTGLLGEKYLCNLVKISGVKLDSVGSNLYAYQGDAQIQIYDSFKKLTGVEIVKGNENNIVTGILVVYKTTYELYPITVDGIVTTAITNLKADSAKAQAPVYNLAGQRVDAAYKGVVIQNGKKFIQR